MKYDEFSVISKPEYYNKTINVKCVVSGKGNVPYYVPNLINIRCMTDKCDCNYKQLTKVELKPTNPYVLLFIDTPSSKFSAIVKQVFRIKCKKFICEATKMQTIERIFIGQIPGEGKKAEHSLRTAYFVGHGIEPNTSYVMKGYTTADPFTQEATHVFIGCEKIRSSIDKFNLSEVYSHLQEFEVQKPTADKIIDKLFKLYETYARNITKIYNRFDLHLAIDLVFHSVLSFKLGDDTVQKGWLDVLIIGDTRTGKGFVASSLVNYYGVGEIVSGENSSFAGLVAGLQQFSSKHWAVTWGRLPLNDTGLVVIDEASNLGDDTWGRLSRIRSEGVADITKIYTQTTDARTRLVFLANPIQKVIANYSYGIEAIQDIIKTSEDIARFDYVLVVSHNEVKISEINKTIPPIDFMYPCFLEQQLVLWTWSRKSNEVVFTDTAKEKIYKASILFGGMYDFSIPLIQGENIRMKIARIAVAFAARVFSNKDKGRILLVDACHVECACFFLSTIYKKESCGYYQRSQMKKLEEPTEDWKTNVENYLKAYANKNEVYKYFLTANTFTAKDLTEFLGVQPPVAVEVISKLLTNNCLQKKHGYYVKSSSFTTFLKNKLFEVK